MADNYLQTSFAFTLNRTEAERLTTALALVALLDEGDETAVDAAWAETSPEFKSLFPASSDTPWSGLLDIFSDPDFPQFGATFDTADTADNTVQIHIYGDQFDPDATATLLAAIVTESFPVVCTWAATCSKLRIDEFTGGGFRIDADGLHEISANELFDNSRFAPRFVLALSDAPAEPVFWNKASQFGPLGEATVFTDRDKDRFNHPLDQPVRWLELPKP
ncbi:MAG: hypothetical protein IPM67_15075 [Sphingomonadales bacterium]|jgi:hypothetical protein|nr:hypothetical protein [Sphingomonadales bacterium]MBK9269929.1 hypothetical protein [Sphingomonadales bacterium]